MTRILLVLLLLPAIWAWPVNAQTGGNLLNNPSFEGQYYTYVPNPPIPDCKTGVCNTVQMAPGWSPWWVSRRPDQQKWENRNPEYKPSGRCGDCANRVHSGADGQAYFTFEGTHVAGFYQQVTVPKDAALHFSIYGQAWSSDRDQPPLSHNATRLHMRIGIDPLGGTSALDPRVVWSSEFDSLDTWYRYDVYARAQGTQVTVFVYSAPEEPRKHNDLYWDDAALVVVDRLPTDPLVPPTRAPTRRPTSTPAPTATATLTPPPTATSTLTPIPPSPTTPPFSTICLQAFDDLNGNTRWDTQAEPALAGVTFSLSSTRGISEIVYTSGGFTEPHCLANFPAGDYHLSIEPPAGYEATTARQWQLALSAGSCVEVDFGSRRIEAQALPASRQESATVEPIAWVALAVVVGVIVVFLRRRRRAF